MVVPVPFMSGVAVAVVHVVGVAIVRYGHVAALLPVLMGMARVRHMPLRGALVSVVAVNPVNVAVVRVVGVIAVGNRHMAAARSVSVLVAGVRDMRNGIWHEGPSVWWHGPARAAPSYIRTLAYCNLGIQCRASGRRRRGGAGRYPRPGRKGRTSAPSRAMFSCTADGSPLPSTMQMR